MIQWGTVAEWVSGLGALAAAVAAVWLARDAQRIKIRGTCGVAKTASHNGVPTENTVSLWLSVVNCDTRPVTISDIVIKSRKKSVSIGELFRSSAWLPSTTVPATLCDGESKKFFHPLADVVRKLSEKKMMQKKSDAKKLRFVAHTTRGQYKSFGPNEDLVNAMTNEMGTQKLF
ncbi:MAG: hypothetical protein MPK10_08295 [Gammaproteobacteria bacterium]|nr:hypothetical protein [Gammaproteobacteria bacterium]MDA7994989.1 hypothetical protein [Gammaproteobacteria bacterium]MDA8010150.1 hypothetical protein [Alphaproteobacteria bacterium]